jgi:ribA/ribD-fused uncharacterized protein
MEVIRMSNGVYGFFKEYRFLSNFHLVPITYNGISFPSTENAYQFAKCATQKPNLIRAFSRFTPSEARKLGRQITIREDWEDAKYHIMYALNDQKFHIPELKQMLLDTGDMYLEETNTWGDTYWGVCEGIGENNLGRILMHIRNEIREELSND